MSEVNRYWYVTATIEGVLHVMQVARSGWLEYVPFDAKADPWLFNSYDLAKDWCNTPEWNETISPYIADGLPDEAQL